MAAEALDSSVRKPLIKPPGCGCLDIGSEGAATATPSERRSVSASPRSSIGSQSDASSEVATPKCAALENVTLDSALVVAIVEFLGAHKEDGLLGDALAQPSDNPTLAVGFSQGLVLKCLRLLHASHCSQEDIEVIITHALCYTEDLKIISRREGAPEMQIVEASYVFCVLVFLAYSYTQDQNRPLKVWHRHLFRNYCDLNVLNCAVMGLMEKLCYKLRVRPRRLQLKLSSLLGCCSGHHRACGNPEAVQR